MHLWSDFQCHRLHAPRLLLVTILVNALCYNDDVVCAAEAHAFRRSGLSGTPGMA